MSKILAGLGVLALAVMLALPARAAEQPAAVQPDTALPAKEPAGVTKVSPIHRHYGLHRHYRGHRYAWRHTWWRPRLAYDPFWRPVYRPFWRPWRPWYARYPYYRPYWARHHRYRSYPFAGLFGSRWWW